MILYSTGPKYTAFMLEMIDTTRYNLLYSVSDTALASILDVTGILAQSTAHSQTSLRKLASGLAGLPVLATLSELGLRDINVQNAVVSVDGDDIAVIDKTDGTTDSSLGDDVTNQETVGTTGETAVSDQGTRGAKTGTHKGGRGLQHF